MYSVVCDYKVMFILYELKRLSVFVEFTSMKSKVSFASMYLSFVNMCKNLVKFCDLNVCVDFMSLFLNCNIICGFGL